jgi:hypothetical protein
VRNSHTTPNGNPLNLPENLKWLHGWRTPCCVPRRTPPGQRDNSESGNSAPERMAEQDAPEQTERQDAPEYAEEQVAWEQTVGQGPLQVALVEKGILQLASAAPQEVAILPLPAEYLRPDDANGVQAAKHALGDGVEDRISGRPKGTLHPTKPSCEQQACKNHVRYHPYVLSATPRPTSSPGPKEPNLTSQEPTPQQEHQQCKQQPSPTRLSDHKRTKTPISPVYHIRTRSGQLLPVTRWSLEDRLNSEPQFGMYSDSMTGSQPDHCR